ncbi:FIST N-terminal domain-containing protein [Sulfurimonas paralvinellae]|uniref:Sensory/regulatory protein RpfC n=1 Tax=Sulfurimonas paralvinellae TaxID=317658 RepID=A0A7M1B5Q3_9BACT|nr:FIST N-terminal domain-containing protein [Sulfurimonas paralvinellae]QOP45063.1 response regulator [Sulfurimonas paralvinellae]
MKQYNYIYDTQDAFQNFLQERSIKNEGRNILIQMFTSEHSLEDAVKIAEEITTVLPHAAIIGASTAGEIISGKILEKSTVLSISVFEKTSIELFSASAEDSYKLGLLLSKQIFNAKTKCVITFVDGLQHNGQEYLQGLNAMNYNNAVIAGGMAADMLHFEKTYTICGTKVSRGCAVCVALSGEELEVLQDYNLGWRAVGPIFTITKSDGARVYEINNRPVKDLYKEVLGSFAVENMPASTIEFPLILQDGDMLVARSLLSVSKDGSILYGGNLEEGAEVRFGIGSRTLVNQYNPSEALLESQSLQACFIYSCIARKMFLDKELEKSFKIIENTAPSSGFFTYGEFFFNDQKTKLLNITTTLLFLREKGTVGDTEHHDRTKETIKNQSKTDGALFNLIDYVTTELKEQEKGFKSSKFQLDEFLKALDSVVIISRTDTDGIITYVNERFEEISGYTKEELIGKPHSIVRNPNVEDAVFAKMWETITKGNIWKGEFSNRAKDGSLYYVKSSIIPIHDENSEIIEYMAIREDVTSLVESRKKAEAAEAAQSMFLANMSHEIRTPMNGILGFSELLAKTKLDASQQKYIKAINSSTKILLDIVNDILDSSKITSNKIVFEKLAINPYEEFATTYELLKTTAQEKSINYVSEIDENISKCLLGDATRLRQIKINLLSNAIKFTPKFGEVRFTVSLVTSDAKSQTLLFSVEDSGIGIAKEKLQDIFKPFSQADASTTRKFGGTGLGLSISSDLIKAFGSELKVDSEVGKGSRFYFTMRFDICEDEVTKEVPAADAVCQNDEECNKLHLNVLAAEDYDVNRMLIESIFEKYKNIELSFAVNGKDAIEKLQQNDFDLVLMDINMPVLNGIDATRYIRQKLHRKVPIVALTANALEGDREKFLECGMDEYLSKPIDVEALENILCKYSKTETEMYSRYIDTVLERLKLKLGLSETVSKKLLKTFLESLKEILPELQEALELKDVQKVYETAHKLKGAAGALYIGEIYEIMLKIETAAQQGIIVECEEDMKQVCEYVTVLEKAL